MFSLFSVVLAALGLGILIFIHELGHYWMARREGMIVEVFSIGFGRPFRTWEFQGVKWQLCILPFGGYVKIAGTEKKGSLEPHQIPDGFYGKRPWARIKVALAGPVVNIVFAFLAFSLLWVTGGRLKSFSDFTHLIGWVDPSSPSFASGIRPGDQIEQLNHKPFHQFQDLLYSAVLDETPPLISGREVNYFTGEKKPFEFQFPVERKGSTTEKVSSVLGALSPASYLIYNRRLETGSSPMFHSGIAYGDRIVWVDGEVIFSRDQLVSVVNQSKVLLTVQRGKETILCRVPRVKVSDLRILASQKAELEDWQHESQIKGKISDLFFIPYDLTVNCFVEQPLSYLNEETLEQKPGAVIRSLLEIPLQQGDKILAVDGITVHSSYEMLRQLQTRLVQIIVKKEQSSQPVSWLKADESFLEGIAWDELAQMIHSIGTPGVVKESGDLKMLNPVTPTPRSLYPFPEEIKSKIAKEFEEQKKVAEGIEDPDQKAQLLRLIEEANHQLMLGIVPTDRQVIYNPSPWALFGNVFKETWRTLFALFSGNISPKYMQGPVGMVQVMHSSWMIGFKEAVFWLGMISLNLGILNLLPVPVLDGGHICFSIWEWISKKPVKAKVMERLIIPFMILLIALFIYLTYHDLVRLLSRFF